MALRKALTATMVLVGAALSACGHDQTQARLEPGFGLHFNDLGDAVTLAYGLANSDDVALMLQCVKGSGMVEVSDTARAGPVPRVELASDGERTVIPVSMQSGESDAPAILTGQVSLDADALRGFRRSGRIRVAFGKVRYGLQASAVEREGVERFFTACGKAA